MSPLCEICAQRHSILLCPYQTAIDLNKGDEVASQDEDELERLYGPEFDAIAGLAGINIGKITNMVKSLMYRERARFMAEQLRRANADDREEADKILKGLTDED